MDFKFDPEAARHDPRLGGIGARFGARIIDVVAVYLITLALAAIVHPSLDKNATNLGFVALASLASLLYEVPSTAIVGQTLGKFLLRIRVTRVEDGGMPGWGRAFVRYLTVVIAEFIPILGVILGPVIQLWFLWDPRRQNIPDKFARTLVVKVGMEQTGTTHPDVIDLP